MEEEIIDNNNEEDFTSFEETETESYEEVFQEEIEESSIDEVLQLTEYNGGLVQGNNSYGVVAEYENIEIAEISLKHKKQAESFVTKITNFILEFNDVELSPTHRNYIKQVAKLQLGHLQDLMELIDINKQMLNNIVRRVNATQVEDYAVINTYNSLVNQHLKLIKEVQNSYRGIPNVLKKMKADVMCNQELEGNSTNDEVITEDSGVTQFTNQKQLLRTLIEQKKKNKEALENVESISDNDETVPEES